MVIVEKAFPRGGQVNTPAAVPDKYRFGAKSVKKVSAKGTAKKKADKKKKRKNESDKGLIAKSAVPISRKTIQEGMLIMGFVTKIEKTQIHVALPSKLKGTVQLTAVSECYTQALEKLLASGRTNSKVPQLEDIFTIGQSVCCKVIGFSTKNHFIELSVNPKDTHADLNHGQLNEGMVLTGALASWEDHGAVIDVGIANTRCFLARSPKTAGLNVGQLVQCRIETLTKTASTANVTLSVATESKEREVDLETIEQVDRLLPTTEVRLAILNNTLRSGVSGKILDGQFDAFINEQHLGAGKKISDFAIGQEIVATVLYVMPLTKFVYLTLNKFMPVEKRLQEGSIHENVAVLSVHANGVLVKLDKKSLGLLSIRNMKTGEKNLEDLQRKYGSVVKQVRVIYYDPMDGVYACTDDAKLIAEKYLRFSDLTVGQTVRCKVREPMKTHGILVKVGQLNGFIYKLHLEKALLKSKVGATIKARVLHVDEAKNTVHLTTLKEFMKADLKDDLLIDRKTLKVGKDFLGIITNITPKFIFVEFFDKQVGTLKNEATGGSPAAFRVGTVMRFNVTKFTDDRIHLNQCKQKASHKVGEVLKGTVIGMFESGVELEVPGQNDKITSVWVDKEFTTEFPELVPHMCLSFRRGEAVSAIAVSNTSYSIRDAAAFQRYPLKERIALRAGQMLRAYVDRATDSGLFVKVPLLDGTELAKLPYSAVLMNEDVEDKKELFEKNQLVYVKLTKQPSRSTKNLPLSARLDQTFSGNGYATINYLKDYFIQLAKVHKPMFMSSKFKFNIGSKVDGEVLKVIKAGAEYEIQFGGKFKGNLKTAANLAVKEAIKCVIVWIDETGSIFLTNDDRVLAVEGESSAIAFTNEKERAYIVYQTKYCYVVLLEGARSYAFVPIRLHYNDFQPVLADLTGRCRVVVMHTNGDRKIALLAEVYDKMVAVGMKVQTPGLKRALEVEEIKDEPEDGEDEESDEDDDEQSDVEMVDEEDDEEVEEEAVVEEEPLKKKKKVEQQPKPAKKREFVPAMVGNPVVIDEKSAMSNFWTMDFDTVQSNNAATDFAMELDEEEEASSKKTHKQGPSETDIRNLEEALASSANIPSSAAEFERLVLATPNNSLIWIKFMVFHLQALEVDKARHVFRRALKAINFRWQDDILNVWVAYLNLELRYGTPETFEQAFTEALATNDQFKVTIRTVEILADSDKIAMCKAKATIAMKKFKDRAELWPKVGAAYFRMGLREEANQLVNKALAVLEKRDHLQVIVEFAKLNRANGQIDVASTFLEQILTSYPKRTDIWSFYIDMLVKENDVDSARAVSERATSQKLPAKKMKTLFKKYLEFEERFGDEKAVAHVKQMASEYVQSQQ